MDDNGTYLGNIYGIYKECITNISIDIYDITINIHRYIHQGTISGCFFVLTKSHPFLISLAHAHAYSSAPIGLKRIGTSNKS